jgi:putative effector of murein hydrolase
METVLSLPVTGIVISFLCYGIGCVLKNKIHSPLVNPQIIATVIIISLFYFTPLTYEAYMSGAELAAIFIVPATTVLAIKIYKQRALLKLNIIPVFAGCFAGAAASIISIVLLCKLFAVDDIMRISLTPKSVTTAIAMELSNKNGGIVSVTIAAVVITGMTIVMFSPLLIKCFKLKDSVAAGVAVGASGHALGTTKAIELGEIQGAMSGIAMGVSGIFTSIIYLFLF